MNTIKARLAHPPKEEWTGQYFNFVVIGYAVPKDCLDHNDYHPGGCYANWYYVNSNGFAQQYDPAKPPSKFPTPGRLIVLPTYEEPIFKEA